MSSELGLNCGVARSVGLGLLDPHGGADDDVAVEGGEHVNAGGDLARHGHHEAPDEVTLLAGARLVYEVLALSWIRVLQVSARGDHDLNYRASRRMSQQIV